MGQDHLPGHQIHGKNRLQCNKHYVCRTPSDQAIIYYVCWLIKLVIQLTYVYCPCISTGCTLASFGQSLKTVCSAVRAVYCGASLKFLMLKNIAQNYLC